MNSTVARNIRHDIDPLVVADAVARKLAEIDRRAGYLAERARLNTEKYLQDVAEGTVAQNWVSKPPTPEDAEAFRLEARAEEENHYAKVRVIELPQEGSRFILVYGDTDDETVQSGTGPFDTFEAAVGWFTRLGR